MSFYVSPYQNHFGSWNKAIEAAGFTPNINDGFGIRTLGKDGILYRSQYEAKFADNYLYNKYKYEYEKPYGNGWYYDFYLPEQDLYIEINGGLRKERNKEKIEYNRANNIKCIVLEASNLEDFKKHV